MCHTSGGTGNEGGSLGTETVLKVINALFIIWGENEVGLWGEGFCVPLLIIKQKKV